MDIICFSINNWEKRRARKQQFMAHFAMKPDVGQVLYVEPALNFWRLMFLFFLELKTMENRRRWKRALLFKREAVADKLLVYTPIFFIPLGFRFYVLYRSNLFFAWLVLRKKIKQWGYTDVVLWLYHPFDRPLLDWFSGRKIACFDWAEEWGDYFTEYSAQRCQFVRKLEEAVVRNVDLVFTVSQELLSIARALNPRSFQIHDGTIQEIFLKKDLSMPEDLSLVKHPIVGYVGTVSFRVDVALISYLSEKMPECSFVLIGNIHLRPEELSPLINRPNVFFLGGKAYTDLPSYTSHFDVCFLPYKTALAFVPPATKIFDYLATGKPIVCSYSPELEFLGDCITVAKTPEDFVELIKRSLQENSPVLIDKRIKMAQDNSWAKRTDEIMKLIANTFTL
jgi:glycosyltransferase involved in cell wall biosynthesis